MPDGSVFAQWMDRLEKWYGRKPLTEDQQNRWFDIVGHIPNEAFAEIMQTCIEVDRYFPIPSTVKRMWADWLKEHQGQVDSTPRYPCDECGGQGKLTYWICRSGQIYAYDAACAKCENWKAVFPSRGNDIPKRMTRDSIIDMGGTFHDPDIPPQTGNPKKYRYSVNTAVNMATKAMPEVEPCQA